MLKIANTPDGLPATILTFPGNNLLSLILTGTVGFFR